MPVIDLKTRQEIPARIAELEQDNEYLRSQLRAQRMMRYEELRKKHPRGVVIGIWLVGACYLLDSIVRIISL